MKVVGIVALVAVVYAWVRYVRWGFSHRARLNELEHELAELPAALGVPLVLACVSAFLLSLFVAGVAVTLVVTG